MKKIVIVGGFVLSLFIWCVSAALAENGVEETLKATFPNVKFESVTPSPIKGLYEVVAAQQVAYFSPERGILILGQMIDKTGKNITAERVNEITALAGKHGFRLSGFRSFEREVTDQQIEIVRRNAQRQRSARKRSALGRA